MGTGMGGESGVGGFFRAGAAPCGAGGADPVEESGFEADVAACGFAEDPFMAEDFLAFGEVVAVGGGAAASGVAVFVGVLVWGHGWRGGMDDRGCVFANGVSFH